MIAWLVVVLLVSCFDAVQRLIGVSTFGGGVLGDLGASTGAHHLGLDG